MSSSSSSPSKICSNVSCKETKSEQWRKGWRLRSGELAELCDRCGSAFEEVKFCEIFHADVAGWRNCESCGKRLHCGCIASVHAYLLLDVGGVECLPCAKKNFYMASNPMWSSSLFLPVNLPERLKDSSVKNWNQITGPTIAPRQRRQPANIWNTSTGQSELHSRLPYEVDRPNGVDNVVPSEHPPASLEKKIEHPSEMVTAALDRLANDTMKGLAAESSLTSSVSGLIFEKHPSSCANNSFQSSAPKDSSSTSLFGMSVPFSSSSETHDPVRVSGPLTQCQTPPAPLAKQFCHSPNNGIDSSGELHSQVQVRNGRLRAEARVRNQLLPRYWPRITDQELQQISGDSNSVVTPLFEKMLSASDAGRIGRLVLPKKCAEAYFPTISQPEGLPLKVQDARGKEWVFQFRFWPNNNSRMYVLEGVTPCIQSMQLQAGDTVTFSRMEPDGKLVMGFRKASSVPFEQDTLKTGNGISTSGDVNSRNGKSGEVPATCPLRPSEVGGETNSNSTMNHLNPTDSANSRGKLDKPRSAPKDGARSKSSSLLNKKQSNKLGSKSKRLKIDNEDSMVLRLTWEEAQDLLRPPPKIAPNIVVIEGHEFEEYEEAPVLGRPTFFTTNASGENYQWAQCDQCFKWRKLPADALMPAEWHCYLNCSWDSERARCDAPQELTTEQLEALITSNIAASKRKKAKVENDSAEASEGLDTLANVAILGEGGSLSPSAQATTKHPRHRPGCTCIVCIQPPSGKGPKHKQTCICNVCLTVRRRFRTLMLRREKRQSEKESGTSHKKQHIKLHAKLEPEEEPGNHTGIHNETMDKQTLIMEGFSDDFKKESTPSPFKGRIDLNIQPEREDELSQASDPSSTMRLPRDETGVYFRDQRSMDPDRNRDSISTQIEPGCNIKEEKPDEACSHMDVAGDQTVVVSLSVSTSSPATC